MHIHRDGNLLKAVRISGSTHNLLCAEIILGGEFNTNIECLPVQFGAIIALDSNVVLQEVQMGLQDASEYLGYRVTAKKVQFLPSDSPPASVYRCMAEALAMHFAKELVNFSQKRNGSGWNFSGDERTI